MPVPSKAAAAAQQSKTVLLTFPREFNYFRYGLTALLVLAKLGVFGGQAYLSLQHSSWWVVFLPAYGPEALLLAFVVGVIALLLALGLVVVAAAAVATAVYGMYLAGKLAVSTLVRKVRQARQQAVPHLTPGELQRRARLWQQAVELSGAPPVIDPATQEDVKPILPNDALEQAIQNAIRFVSRSPKEPPTP